MDQSDHGFVAGSGLRTDVCDGELMKEKPRKQGESLFAHGGGVCTLFYGFLIALISLTAFLIVPAKLPASSGRQLTPAAVADVLQSPKLLACCQTYAFTVLGLSQLFSCDRNA